MCGVGWGWVGGKIFPRIRLTSAKVLVEVEAELGKKIYKRKTGTIEVI